MTTTWMAVRRRWKSGPRRRAIWNRIPADIHDQIIELALEQSELIPRELAVRVTDEKRYFESDATIYRLLKASHAYVVIKAGKEQGRPPYQTTDTLHRAAVATVAA